MVQMQNTVALTETTEVMSDIKRAVKVSSNLNHYYEMTCLYFTGLKLCSLPQACAPLQTCKKKERKKKDDCLFDITAQYKAKLIPES